MAVASAGPYASLHLAPDRQPRQHPTTQFFYRPDALPATQPTASKQWRTQVSQYQKGKTNLDFTEARDSEWQWHQLGHMQVCTLLQTDNHASILPFSFYRPDALPASQPTASMHWRHGIVIKVIKFNNNANQIFSAFSDLKINYVPLHKNWCILSEILAIEMFTILNIIQPPPF